jgi:hypothetical protein
MSFLPVADSLSILVIPEIVLVLRLGQPGALRLAFSGLAAVWF